ncbi:MAG: asparagine synthase (glutamine-hydrolyzing) [bacterium]
MCGICGKLNLNGSPVDKSLLEKMTDVLSHRGPDDSGIYIEGEIGLGHRRLSIIDLSFGHQPMSNENGKIWIVFNGEIYNFQELKEGLIKNHSFKTHSDTETIIHLYEDYGIDCVKYLRGMFAFAIWDNEKKRLFLSRDRLGKKPLVYTRQNGSFLFASEIKSILCDKEISKEIDPIAIHHYLSYGYIPSPWTIFKDIKKLPPASILVFEDGKERIERYWMPEYKPKLKISENDAISEILRLLNEAIKLRLISDVPLGAFLSGGIDSSTIVAIMAGLMDRPVKTFSIGFEEEDFSELPYARVVAKHFRTEHQEFIVKPDAIDILPKLAWFYNEPYADSSAIPTYYLSQMTRKYVTVALNGDGGDEIFAGYDRYYACKISLSYDKIPRIIRDAIFNVIKKIPEGGGRSDIVRRIKRFMGAISTSTEIRRRYGDWITMFRNEEKDRLYSPLMKEKIENIDSLTLLLSLYNIAPTDDFLEKTAFTDLMMYLPDDLLVKVDIASMANSLEARSPFLDHKLVEFVSKLPFDMKLRKNKSKYILKKAISNILPKEILKRGKMGFGVPIARWFRNELKGYIYDILLSEKAKNRGYFNMDEIKRILAEHTSGKTNYGYPIWTLLFLEIWHNVFVDK